MADVTRCQECGSGPVVGRGMCKPCYQRDYSRRIREGDHEADKKNIGEFIEPEGGRWWRDCLSDEARMGLEAWLAIRQVKEEVTP